MWMQSSDTCGEEVKPKLMRLRDTADVVQAGRNGQAEEANQDAGRLHEVTGSKQRITLHREQVATRRGYYTRRVRD